MKRPVKNVGASVRTKLAKIKDRTGIDYKRVWQCAVRLLASLVPRIENRISIRVRSPWDALMNTPTLQVLVLAAFGAAIPFIELHFSCNRAGRRSWKSRRTRRPSGNTTRAG